MIDNNVKTTIKNAVPDADQVRASDIIGILVTESTEE